MTREHTQLGPSAGATPPSEAALLAWIEGEALDAGTEREVMRYMASDPAAARRIELMRRDCQAMRRLSVGAAPADLLARVGQHLERGADLTEQVGSGLRLVHPPAEAPGKRWWRALFQEARGRRVAAIAAALLFTGAGVTIATIMLSRSSTGSASMTPIARGPSKTSADSATLAAASGEQMPIASAAWTAEGLIAHEAHQREQGIITPTLAMDLAQQGQLVVRVRTHEDESTEVAARLQRPHQGWFLAGEAPVDAASLLSADETVELMGPPEPGRGWSLPSSGSVYVVRTRLDAGTIEAIKSSLSSTGEVAFEQAPQPMNIDPAELRPVVPARGIAAPAAWAAVPIVVERRQ